MLLVQQSLIICVLPCASLTLVGSSPQNQLPLPPAPEKTRLSLDLADLLPAGAVHVEAMHVESSPHLTEIGRKFQAATRKHPKWFMAQAQKVKPGHPIPYSPNLGLTKAEYKDILNAFPSQMYLRKVGEVSLTIKTEGAKRIFDGGTDLTDFTGIEIDLASRTVKTPYGVLRKTTMFQANSGQAVIGQWDGMEWKLENTSNTYNLALMSATIVEFALGKVKASGKTQLRYRVQQVEGGKPKANFEYILRCDATPKSTPPQ